MNTNDEDHAGTTYTAVPTATREAVCDWCDEWAVAVVRDRSVSRRRGRDWMCPAHLATYHPTLTV